MPLTWLQDDVSGECLTCRLAIQMEVELHRMQMAEGAQRHPTQRSLRYLDEKSIAKLRQTVGRGAHYTVEQHECCRCQQQAGSRAAGPSSRCDIVAEQVYCLFEKERHLD